MCSALSAWMAIIVCDGLRLAHAMGSGCYPLRCCFFSLNRMMRLLPLLLLLFLSFPATAADDGPTVARVFKAFNGHSFLGRTRYHSMRVRLDGVQSAALKYQQGLAAKKVLEKMMLGQRVQVHAVGPEQDEFIPSRIRFLDKDINAEMIRTGYAWVWPRDDNAHPELMAIEQQARDAGKGVWADPAAVAPWTTLSD